MLIDALVSMYKKITEIVCAIFLIVGLIGGFMLCGNLAANNEEAFSFLAGFIGAILGFLITLVLEIAIVPPMMMLMQINENLENLDIPRLNTKSPVVEISHKDRPYQYYSEEINTDSGEEKICPKCGAKNPKANTTCSQCGAYL